MKIDHQKSRRWSLASLGSVGVGYGPVGGAVQLFDLVNLHTGRAHRMQLVTGGGGLGLPISGSFGASDYSDFTTQSDVNFFDFDGAWMSVLETNAIFYSWTSVTMLGVSVNIADGGLSIPSHGLSVGTAKIHFSDGRPVGTPQLEPAVKLPSSDPAPRRSTESGKEDDAGVLVPSDVLFAFDKYLLKPGRQTDELLHDVVRLMAWGPDHRYLIEGHTDSVGGVAYNEALGKRRADTVAAWIKARYPHFGPQLKTVGIGERRPVESNATPEGRAKNRRVEVWTLPMKFWKDY